MKIILLIILFLPVSTSVFATGQAGDLLIWHGDTVELLATPLENYPQIDSLRPLFFDNRQHMYSTGCWRGYVAEWTIENKQLYLVNIYGEGRIRADLGKLFGEQCQNGRVAATWVTDNLRVPIGKMLYYIHSGFMRAYEKDWLLIIGNGKLIRRQKFDNSKTHISPYLENDGRKLQNFILSHIRWDSIPNLGDQKIKVYISCIPGDGTNPKLKIIRPCDDEKLNQEASRVALLIPEWTVFYILGKPYGYPVSFPIIFSEANRKRAGENTGYAPIW